MKKIKSLSIITLFLTSIVSPMQAMSLCKSLLTAFLAFNMTNGGVTPQPDYADNLATTLEPNFLLTDNYNNPPTLKVKKLIAGPSYVENRKYFVYPISAEYYFEGEGITLSMVVDGEEGTKELSGLKFDKEKYGYYTLYGKLNYNPLFDNNKEHINCLVVATDRYGNQVGQAFTLYIRGLDIEYAWLFWSYVTLAGIVSVGLIVYIPFIPGRTIKKALLNGDYKKAQEGRSCCLCPGKNGGLYYSDSQFEQVKEEVHEIELDAVIYLVDEAKIAEISKSTGIPTKRLGKWKNLLNNMISPKKIEPQKLLDDLKLLENKADTSEEDGMPLTIKIK